MPHVGFCMALETIEQQQFMNSNTENRNQQNWRLFSNPSWRYPCHLRRLPCHHDATSRCYSRHCGDTHTFAAPLTSSRSHARKRGDTHVIAALRTSSRRYGLHRGARHGVPKITSTQRDLRRQDTRTPKFPSADFATPIKLQMEPKRPHSATFTSET